MLFPHVKFIVISALLSSLVFGLPAAQWPSGNVVSTGLKQGNKGVGYLNEGIMIIRKWELPHKLKEISGIVCLNENRFACVQDEEGKIFIYNTNTERIEKEIVITSNGDFEGIAIVDSIAYILRSDGTLFEGNSYLGGNLSIKEYHSFFKRRDNIEGLCYDKKNSRLLLAVKDNDPGSKAYKGIYSFDLRKKVFEKDPVYKIDLEDSHFAHLKNKKKMRPSDLAIHPISNEIYILDGEMPKLIILSTDGTIKKLYKLDPADFPLPEGISFDKNGTLFISSEGRGGRATIVNVQLNEE